MRNQFTSIAISLVVTLIPFVNSTVADDVSLTDAIERKQIRLKITGLGASSGDSIKVIIQRIGSDMLRISVPTGTVFKSATGKVQNMVAHSVKGELISDTHYRAGSRIILSDNEVRRFIVEAYCLDFDKPNPSDDDVFSVAATNDRAQQLFSRLTPKDADPRIIQAAIWLDSGVQPPDLKSRYPVTDDHIASANKLLKADDTPPTSPKDTTQPNSPSSTANTGTDKQLEHVLWQITSDKDGTNINIGSWGFFRDGIYFQIDRDLEKLIRVPYTLDDSKTPKQIDYAMVITSLPAIYKIEEDTLTVHMASIGRARPTDFTKSECRVFKRVAEQDKWRKQLEALQQIQQLQQVKLNN